MPNEDKLLNGHSKSIPDQRQLTEPGMGSFMSTKSVKKSCGNNTIWLQIYHYTTLHLSVEFLASFEYLIKYCLVGVGTIERERTSLALVMNRATHSLHKYPAAHKVKVFRLCRRRLRLNCTRGICRRLRAVCLTNGLVQRAKKWQWQWNGCVKISAAIQLVGGVARWEVGEEGREEGSPWNHEMLLIYFI